MCVWLKSFACSYPLFLGLLNEVCVLSTFVEDYFCQFIGTCRFFSTGLCVCFYDNIVYLLIPPAPRVSLCCPVWVWNSLCRSGWLGTHRHLLASAFLVMGLEAWVITPGDLTCSFDYYSFVVYFAFCFVPFGHDGFGYLDFFLWYYLILGFPFSFIKYCF